MDHLKLFQYQFLTPIIQWLLTILIVLVYEITQI